MRSFLAVVMVLCMASFVMAQPPKGDKGPLGVKGEDGKPPVQMRELMQKRMEMMKRFRGGEQPEFQGRRGYQRGPHMKGQGRRGGHGPQFHGRRGHQRGPHMKGQQHRRGGPPQRSGCERCKNCSCKK